MEKINYFEAQDFSKETVISLKQNKKIFVIFSTFGEREADLIYDKITLLRNELGDFIDEIFLSHRRAGHDREMTEEKAREAFAGTNILICNNYEVPDMRGEKGKGADMRRMLYYINMNYRAKEDTDIVLVFLDADVVAEHFWAHFVAALSGAVLKGNDFVKASFWRAMGRVKKYVAQPLFSVIDHPILNKLKDFAYPLSGEVAGTLAFFNAVSFWQIYGVETGINIDSCFGEYTVADVNLGLYDHEHHGETNIQKMSFGIIRTYIKQLVDYGVITLADNAKISNVFKASLINEDAEREKIEFDLTEKKYQPLNDIL